MDYPRAVKKFGLGVVAIALLNAQSAQDPADVLAEARDKLMPRLPRPGYGCVVTIDRSYFSRQRPPVTPRSCEQTLVDRRTGRAKLQLDKTDRLRVEVRSTPESEIYS